MENKSIKSEIVGFVRANKSVFIFLAVVIGVVAVYLAWKNRERLTGWVKDNYKGLSDKVDKTLTKFEGK